MSDLKTLLKEEFIEKVQLLKLIEDIGAIGAKGTMADWWLSKLDQSYEQGKADRDKEVLEKCDTMRDNTRMMSQEEIPQAEKRGYNQALSDLKNFINH